MFKSSFRNSIAVISSATCLLGSQSEAAKPELFLVPGDDGGVPKEIVVEHDLADQSTLNLQFSDDLKTWKSESESTSLELNRSEISPLDPGRMLSYFQYNPEISVEQRFFRALVNGDPIIAYRMHGLNFSPYIDADENPERNTSGQITETELRERLQHIAPYTEWVRSFGVNEDLEPIGEMAHEMGLKAAIGAWIGKDLSENQIQIDNLVALAIKGDVDLAIVGSEALLRQDVSLTQLIDYITEVRSRLNDAGIDIPVATADVYGSFLNNPSLFNAVDVVLPNIYPYWEGLNVDYAVAYLDRSFKQLQAAAGGLPIVISETGWPTAGDRRGEAIPSVENAVNYLHTFISWAEANEVDYWTFSTYDERWKVSSEGPQGATWGVWDGEQVLKPGMEVLFSGEMLSSNLWQNVGSDEPVIDVFTSPDFITSNLRDFLVSGIAEPGQQVQINGIDLEAYQTNSSGVFAAIVPLSAGINDIEIAVYESGTAEPVRVAEKIVEFDPAFSTDAMRLIYVDLVDDGEATPSAPGTVVIDLDNNAILGIIPDRHIRGISPEGDEIYMADLGVVSAVNHTDLYDLPFSKPINSNSFVVDPAGQVLLSDDEIVDAVTNQQLNQKLPASIQTGSSWSGAPIPGGPAAMPDGSAVLCGNHVNSIDLSSNILTSTDIYGFFMSDITVSPDGQMIAVSTYDRGNGKVDFYNANTYEWLGGVGRLGDFNGEVEFAGDRAIVGSSGNPSYGGGYVSVIDTNTFEVLSQLSSPLADNIATSPSGEIFAAVGLESDGVLPARQGVDVYVVSEEGQEKGVLRRVKTFFLGVNRWVSSSGRPSYDQINDIQFKPAND